MTTCAYKPCSVAIHFRLFLISVGILWGSFGLFLHCFKKSSGKYYFHQRTLVIYICRFSSNVFYDVCGYFQFSRFLNVNLQCLLIYFCISFLFNINIHIISIVVYCTDPSSCCDIFISIFLYSHRRHLRICSIYWCSSQTSFQFINHHFLFKNSL